MKLDFSELASAGKHETIYLAIFTGSLLTAEDLAFYDDIDTTDAEAVAAHVAACIAAGTIANVGTIGNLENHLKRGGRKHD